MKEEIRPSAARAMVFGLAERMDEVRVVDRIEIRNPWNGDPVIPADAVIAADDRADFAGVAEAQGDGGSAQPGKFLFPASGRPKDPGFFRCAVPWWPIPLPESPLKIPRSTDRSPWIGRDQRGKPCTVTQSAPGLNFAYFNLTPGGHYIYGSSVLGLSRPGIDIFLTASFAMVGSIAASGMPRTPIFVEY